MANASYWADKRKRNRKRGRKALAELAALDWRVLVLWECELLDLEPLRKRLCKTLA